MILFWLIAILLGAGILAWFVGRISTLAARWISLIAVAVDFLITLGLWAKSSSQISLLPQNRWFDQLNWSWIPQFGIHFHLAMDGLSLLMVLLTLVVGILAILASWREITDCVGFFHMNLMWVLGESSASSWQLICSSSISRGS